MEEYLLKESKTPSMELRRLCAIDNFKTLNRLNPNFMADISLPLLNS